VIDAEPTDTAFHAPALGDAIDPDASKLPGLPPEFEYTPTDTFVAVVPLLTYTSMLEVDPEADAVYSNA
jgi:hypothetical protein